MNTSSDPARQLAGIRQRLEELSTEMLGLIHTYDLDATDPLLVIPVAREKIRAHDDYVRFLELSLEGRILGEVAEHLEQAVKDGPVRH